MRVTAQPRSLGGAIAACALCALLAGACSAETHIRLLEPSGLGEGGSTSGPVRDAASAPAPDAAPDAATDAPADAALDAAAADAASQDGTVADAAPADAAAPRGGLLLRYDFSGSGTRVPDLAGSADAQLIGGAALDGAGAVELDGVDDYVDLPNGVLSNLTSATIVAWLAWHGGVCWQRIFDFGSNDAGEGAVGNGLTSLFATPANCARGVLMASAELGAARHDIAHVTAMPQGRLVQVALRFDAARELMTLFLDGAPIGQAAAPFQLSDFDDINSWLGRSQWVQDYHLHARYDELRIYDYPLPASHIAELHARGPDAL